MLTPMTQNQLFFLYKKDPAKIIRWVDRFIPIVEQVQPFSAKIRRNWRKFYLKRPKGQKGQKVYKSPIERWQEQKQTL